MDNLKNHFIVWFIMGWFASSATALIFAVLFSFYLSDSRLAEPKVSNFKLYAALPKEESRISVDIERADARAKIVEQFFKGYQTPLASFSDVFIKVADKYSLDFRLLPAIAMQESNGGKKVVENSYNPFGYGIYDKLVRKFNSWEEAIERVGKALREDYLNQGLTTPVQIMTKYTPPSLTRDGAWARGVSSLMEELR